MSHYDETRNRFNPQNRFVGDIEDGKRYPFACYTKEESDARYAPISTVSDIANLNATVATKATKADVTALEAVVGTKASQADFIELSATVDTKASISSVESLSETVNTKANQSALDSLGLVVQNGCLCVIYESEG